jgi:hypothetical protein
MRSGERRSMTVRLRVSDVSHMSADSARARFLLVRSDAAGESNSDVSSTSGEGGVKFLSASELRVITPPKFTHYETHTDASDYTSDIGSQDPRTASGNTPSKVTFAPDGHHANLVVVQTETMLRLSDAPITVFDSGCSISGTSNIINLTDITGCGPLSVQGAFGPSTQPKKRGLLTPLGLNAILLPGMGNQTLLSLFQYCAGCTSGVQNVGVLIKSGFRIFSLNSALFALKLLSEHGLTRGTVYHEFLLLFSLPPAVAIIPKPCHHSFLYG